MDAVCRNGLAATLLLVLASCSHVSQTPVGEHYVTCANTAGVTGAYECDDMDHVIVIKPKRTERIHFSCAGGYLDDILFEKKAKWIVVPNFKALLHCLWLHGKTCTAVIKNLSLINDESLEIDEIDCNTEPVSGG